MSIRKQAIPLLHLDTGPPVRNPCSSDTVFHADDRIISSISVNQKGYEHLKTNLPQKKNPIPFLLLSSLCHSLIPLLSLSGCHYIPHSVF